VIVITSRDSDAILLLYRCLRHSHTEHELRTIFHHLNFFKSDRKISDCTFWKILYKRKFSFLLISCTRNRHSTVIENYIRRNDVIKCELDLAFIEKLIQYLISQMTVDFCREKEKKNVDKFSQIVATRRLIDFHRLLSRDVFVKRVAIRFLKRREIERICLWLMILSNRQLSFDRWERQLSR
jgi:hypothetical protein